MEPVEEAVRALDLPVFETAGPAAIPRDDGEGEVLKEKGKAKVTHRFIVGAALPVMPAKLVRMESSLIRPICLKTIWRVRGDVAELTTLAR